MKCCRRLKRKCGAIRNYIDEAKEVLYGPVRPFSGSTDIRREYINADDDIAFCLYIMNKMR